MFTGPWSLARAVTLALDVIEEGQDLRAGEISEAELADVPPASRGPTPAMTEERRVGILRQASHGALCEVTLERVRCRRSRHDRVARFLVRAHQALRETARLPGPKGWQPDRMRAASTCAG